MATNLVNTIQSKGDTGSEEGQGSEGGVILSRMVRKGLSEKMSFEQKPEEKSPLSHSFSGREKACTKDVRQERSRCA